MYRTLIRIVCVNFLRAVRGIVLAIVNVNVLVSLIGVLRGVLLVLVGVVLPVFEILGVGWVVLWVLLVDAGVGARSGVFRLYAVS